MRVLHTLAAPDGTTRYVDHMIGGARDGVEVRTFTWPRAILGRYDILHVHWPEALVRHPTAVGRAVKRTLLELLLARLRVTRAPVVRTLHNVVPHEDGGSAEARLLARIDRRTDLWILLQAGTPTPDTSRSVVIPHGHYRDLFRSGVAAVPGRVLQFGLLRPYKGVESLIFAFKGLSGSSLELRVVGKPHSPAFAEALRHTAADDERITLRFGFVPDRDLVDEIRKAELVVLPYTEMHNSGAVLLALSLDRPVLVPRSRSTDDLAEEVGDDWVLRYDGVLSSTVLDAARADAAKRPRKPPQLSGRDWDRIGRLHSNAYRIALEQRGSSRLGFNGSPR